MGFNFYAAEHRRQNSFWDKIPNVMNVGEATEEQKKLAQVAHVNPAFLHPKSAITLGALSVEHTRAASKHLEIQNLEANHRAAQDYKDKIEYQLRSVEKQISELKEALYKIKERGGNTFRTRFRIKTLEEGNLQEYRQRFADATRDVLAFKRALESLKDIEEDDRDQAIELFNLAFKTENFCSKLPLREVKRMQAAYLARKIVTSSGTFFAPFSGSYTLRNSKNDCFLSVGKYL